MVTDNNNENMEPIQEIVEKGDPVNGGNTPATPTLNPKRSFIRLLLLVYLVMVVAFGYWYWMRPIRATQLEKQHNKWREIGEVFKVPIPSDETWSDN